MTNEHPSWAFAAVYTFDKCLDAEPDITQVTVENLSQPVAGQPVDFDIDLGGDGYIFSKGTESFYTNGLLWYDTTASKYLYEGDIYEADHVYWLIIPITAVWPNQFAVGSDGNTSMTAKSIADNTYVIDPHKPGNPRRKMEIHCEFAPCKEPIRFVAVEGIKEPVEGEKPDYFANAVETDKYNIPRSSQNPITWFQDGYEMDPDETFLAGHEYIVQIELYAKDGEYFATDSSGSTRVEGTLDGNTAEFFNTHLNDADKYITLYYRFGTCPDSVIDEVTITGLEMPVPGNYPDYTVTSKESQYLVRSSEYQNSGDIFDKVNGVRWWDYTEGEDLARALYNNQQFVAGHSYYATIDLEVTDRENYSFKVTNYNESQIKVWLNNESDLLYIDTDVIAESGIGGYSDGSYYQTIKCYFPWNGPPTVSDIEVFDIDLPVAGQKPDFEGTTGAPNLYKIGNIDWFDEEGNYVTEDQVFEAKKKYSVCIGLQALQEENDYTCRFNTEDPYIRINGSSYGDIPDQKIQFVPFGNAGDYIEIQTTYIGKKESEIIPVEELEFINDFIACKPFDTVNIASELRVYPGDATNQDIIYSSSDSSVFIPSEDGFRALKEGLAVITASTRDGSKTAKAIVIVDNSNTTVTGEPEKELIKILAEISTIPRINGANYKQEIQNIRKIRQRVKSRSVLSESIIIIASFFPDHEYGKAAQKYLDALEYYENLGLWSTNIPDQIYSGKAVKPEFDVYYGIELLTPGKDYTVSWKNNTNAAKSNAFDYEKGKSIAPTAVIKGKGNFIGTLEKKFTIKPIDLSEYKTNKELQNILEIEPITAKWTGNMIKSVPVLKLNGKTITVKTKEFSVLYEDPASGAYTNVGNWNITVNGSGKNFIGSTTVGQTITPKLITGVTITLDKSSYTYNDETGVTYPGKVVVKDGKTILNENQDYFVSYENCGKIGTATVKISGYGNYRGTKTKTYKITGITLNSKMIRQLDGFVYNGEKKTVYQGINYITDYKGASLVEGTDYTVSYSGDRVNAGKLNVTFKGINNFSGSVTKTYTIEKVPASALQVTLENNASYAKSGAKPRPVVTFNETRLSEGKDYKVTYANNNKVASKEDAKAPYLYITGMGNFYGNTKATPVKFTIAGAKIDLTVNMEVKDIVYKNAKNNFVPSVTLTDRYTGKTLAKKTDYDAVFMYEIYDFAEEAYKKFSADRVRAEDFNNGYVYMRVTVTGINNYSGSISDEYRITMNNIASVTVDKIPDQTYTGKKICPEITVCEKIKSGKNYIYIPLDGSCYYVEYENNINKGTATAYIYGRGNYGGVKKVTFKIVSQKMKWDSSTTN